MDESPGLVAGTMCVLTITFLSPTVAAEEALELQTDSQAQLMDWHLTVVGVLCVAVTVVLALAIMTCTDCYKSEVSTDCHPASASGGPKWGGAGGYSAAATFDVNSSVLTAGFTGEVVVPEDGANLPLPYTLIPSQVPEAQGFRGYAPVEPAGAPGMSGYGSTGAHQPSLAGYGGGGGGQYGYSSTGAHQPSLAGYGGGGGGQYGYGSTEAQQTSLTGYGGGGGGQYEYNMGVQQTSLAGYGGSRGGQWGAAAEVGGGGGQQGGMAQRAVENTGGERSHSLPGAHIPLMSSEPEEPPPSYFSASYR